MNQLTFLDKIQVLFKLLFSSPMIIGIFIFSLLLMIILFFYSKLNKKIIKFIFIGIYVLLLGFTVFKYRSYFLTSIDSFITIFMANIYFPVIPVYALIMFISFVIMIVTLGSKKKLRIVKIINTIFFTLIQMLFAVFIYIVESNKIDLSNNTGIYTNEQTLTLLELGMGLFVVWMVILLVILYLKKADKIFRVKSDDNQDDFDEYINDFNEPEKNKKITTVNEDNRVVNEVNSVSNNFNDSIVKSLVPEVSLFSADNEEVLSFEDSNSFKENNGDSFNKNMSNNSIFENFDFLDVNNQVSDRSNNDVEIIDFD
ncbi:MAG: hypothetical protein J6D28_04870 [Bacilli bacterium]|nr:hypothetical protein [Bacilli bacterium]